MGMVRWTWKWKRELREEAGTFAECGDGDDVLRCHGMELLLARNTSQDKQGRAEQSRATKQCDKAGLKTSLRCRLEWQ